MSADKVTRADLLDALLDADSKGRTLPYRGHALKVRLTVHKRDAELLVDGTYAFYYSTILHDGITGMLVILRDLDYLIDVLDNVDEPNLKED